MPNTAMANDLSTVNELPEYKQKNYLQITDNLSESKRDLEIEKRRCGTGLILNDHYRDFTSCNYVAAGIV